MRTGEILGDRFEIVTRAGAGGMGVVYRARDKLTGATVAVKVVHDPDGERGERFRRETKALSQLFHPAIVRFVGSGSTPEGDPFLAMEWLEGEDLARRLAREGVSASGAALVGQRVLGALAHAHQRGIVHRDIKPSNIYLPSCDAAQAKLLDFGIARLDRTTRVMTATGAMLGSVGYMSPEQALGERALGSPSDLFSLGCVLHRCFAGRPLFQGDSPVSILLQTVHERPPPLADLRPDLPRALCDLVDAMLARAPEDRPSAERAAALLSAVGSLEAIGAPPRPPEHETVSFDERRMVSVIVVRSAELLDVASQDELSGTRAAGGEDMLSLLAGAVAPLGGKPIPLRDDARLVLLEGRSAAQDEAAQAASCALAIHAVLPAAHVVIATGAAEMSGRWAVGPVVDRALWLLEATRPERGGAEPEILMDDVTADLLDERFSSRGSGPQRVLAGARAFAGESRKVLGKPTPCVGRERDLAFLESTFASCEAENEARAVLVLAQAGIGKSRLRREIVARFLARGSHVLLARCDAVYAGSPNHAVAELVRHAVGIHEDESSSARRAALDAYVDRLFAEPWRARAKDFLGELVRVPGGEPSPLLRAARNDPRVMAAQIRDVCEEWLSELAQQRSLVIVLEDVHWSDPSSARLIEGALARLADRPLFVLGLARPEIREVSPPPFASFSELRLDPLGKRAAERLVTSILGAGADPRAVERIVTLAAGNAFYLEELARHVATHGPESLPETVIAMARSRLDELEADARRVLRVGSVFGECFWEEGVVRILGSTRTAESAREWLNTLVEREILEPGRRERFGGERDFVFRHALLRDAAYATLTEDDRKVGHKLATSWLEDVGERDPQVLAEHLLRAGELERAAPYLLRVARSRMDSGDPDGAARTAERGLACRPVGELRGSLLLASAMAHGFRSNFEQAAGEAREAIDLLPAGSVPWFQGAAVLVLAGLASSSPGAIFELVQRLARLETPPDPSQPYAFTLFMITTALVQLGQKDMALAMGARLDAASDSSARSDPAFEGWRDLVRATLADKAKLDRLDEVLAFSSSALAALHACGDRMGEAIAAGWRGRALELAGAFEEAERVGREALDLTERTANAMTRKRALCVVGAALVGQGRHDEAAPFLASVPADDAMARLLARVNIARSALYRGDPDAAADEASATVEAAGFFAPHKASALAVLGAAKLAQGDAAGALAAARSGKELAESAGADVWTGTLLRLVEIEALQASGARSEAALLAKSAQQRLRTIAAGLNEPGLGERFLATRECARTLTLARTASS